jgi:hypothetical protein
MVDIINNPAFGMYVAAAVALVVMTGFFIYLWSLDRQVRDLRQKLEQPQSSEVTAAMRQSNREPLRPQPIEKELSDGIDRR